MNLLIYSHLILDKGTKARKGPIREEEILSYERAKEIIVT